jgi:dihydroorotase-like cyclic amidohydrolase
MTGSQARAFAQASPGVIGVETMLPVGLEMYHRGDIGLLDLLARN